MMLWIFGVMMVGSIFIAFGWLSVWRRYRNPWSVWNAALMLSLGFDLHSIGMAVTTGVRIFDVFAGRNFATETPLVYFGAGALVVAGKTLFVWVAAMGEGREYNRLYWYGYLAAVLAWTCFCTWYWTIGALV